MLRKILLVLLLAFVAIQFIRPAKNLASTPVPDSVAAKLALPADVRRTLEQACFDCHSNSTSYPWYAAVQPVAWFLDSHIREGKSKLNFSQFDLYEAKRAAHKLEELIDEVEKDAMPLRSYTWLHPEARLTADQKKHLIAWAEARRALLTPTAPAR